MAPHKFRMIALGCVVTFVGAGSIWQQGMLRAWACDEGAYRQATLSALSQAGLYPVDEGGCGWLEVCGADRISEARKRADDIRGFANGLQKGCAKDAYLEWARFVDYEADRGEREMKTHERQREFDDYRARTRATDQSAAEITRTLPVPPHN